MEKTAIFKKLHLPNARQNNTSRFSCVIGEIAKTLKFKNFALNSTRRLPIDRVRRELFTKMVTAGGDEL